MFTSRAGADRERAGGERASGPTPDSMAAAMTTRSDIMTRLRLASGLVLMAFASGHLLNHTLGIHSLAAMEAGGRVFTAVWRTAPASLLLYAAFTIHVVLAVHKLWRRRSLKMPAWEMAQVVLGLLIPFWLVVHIIGTRGAYQFLGVDVTYSNVLHTLWPDGAPRQSLMLAGCTAASASISGCGSAPGIALCSHGCSRSRCSCQRWP